MRNFTIFVLCLIFIAYVCGRPEEEKYTDQYDSINIDEILNSNRLLDNYFNCLKTGKKCTPDGQKLREHLSEALQTGCSKCTDVQKRQSKKIIDFLAKNKPNYFKELETIYDPERKYRIKYADELTAEGIVLPD